jgi:hypothetical protein
VVWSTGWAIASAGNPVVDLEAGLLTHDCFRSPLGDSHVAWLQQPERFTPEHHRPCRHEFRHVVPEKDRAEPLLASRLPTDSVREVAGNLNPEALCLRAVADD